MRIYAIGYNKRRHVIREKHSSKFGIPSTRPFLRVTCKGNYERCHYRGEVPICKITKCFSFRNANRWRVNKSRYLGSLSFSLSSSHLSYVCIPFYLYHYIVSSQIDSDRFCFYGGLKIKRKEK